MAVFYTDELNNARARLLPIRPNRYTWVVSLLSKTNVFDHIPDVYWEESGSWHFLDNAQESFARVLVDLGLNHTMFFSANP